MAKSLQRIEARRLRCEEGFSYKEIAKKVNVAKSTISLWCQDIELTADQLRNLEIRSNLKNMKGRLIGARVQRERRLALIKKGEDDGLLKFSSLTENEFFIAGLALYWAEGFKKGGHAGFCNTDPSMMKFIINWLFTFFNLTYDDLKFRVDINEAHINREEAVKEYWIQTLGIPCKQFQKTSFKNVISKKVYENFDQHYGTLRFEILRATRVSYSILGLILGLAKAGESYKQVK